MDREVTIEQAQKAIKELDDTIDWLRTFLSPGRREDVEWQMDEPPTEVLNNLTILYSSLSSKRKRWQDSVDRVLKEKLVILTD